MEIGEADGAREPFRLLQKHKLNQLFARPLFHQIEPLKNGPSLVLPSILSRE